MKGIKLKITAEFRDTAHIRFEDTKGIISPEKFRDFRETGPWCVNEGSYSFGDRLQMQGRGGNLIFATVAPDPKLPNTFEVVNIV